ATTRRLGIEAAIQCRRGDSKMAEVVARRAVDLDRDEAAPVKVASILLLAELLDGQGNAAEAKALIATAKALAPEAAAPLVQEAAASLKAGEVAQANALLAEAINL